MTVRASLTLADAKHAFLYDVRPDLFPYGFLTDLELQLWMEFYEWKNQQTRQ